ncbi:MAG: hypothetical protein LIP02_14985 [Bacteroidales bacterium]|nr:hypothetical protein [Bacteroidales bacterium]
MNLRAKIILIAILIMMVIPVPGIAQSTVKDAGKQAASSTMLDTWDSVKRQREQQKAQEKLMKQKDPSWNPPKELGIPYLGVELGWSRFRGEHAGLKVGLMGFNLFGGVGKEWIFTNHADKSLLWYAGCGYLFGDIYDGSGESSIDITVGQSPLCHDIGIMGSFSLGYFFGRTKRFGVKGTLGVGGGNLDQDEIKFLWEVGVGVVVKLWAD